MTPQLDTFRATVEKRFNDLPWVSKQYGPQYEVQLRETGSVWAYELILKRRQEKPRRKNSRKMPEYIFGDWNMLDSSVTEAFKNIVRTTGGFNVRVNYETWMRVSPNGKQVQLYYPINPE